MLLALGICASTVLASAQAIPSGTANADGSSPVAFIYVISSPSSAKNQMNGYAAAANGSLTKIPGTPAATPLTDIALNSKWLFGTDGFNLYSYSIAGNGSLKQIDKVEVEQDGGLGGLFLDHTGTSLNLDYYTTNNEYMAYGIDNSTGTLSYLDGVSGGPGFGYVASFIGNNEFAYSSSCYHWTPYVYGLQRSSDGAITLLNDNVPIPTAPSGDFYCPYLAAANTTNNVAIAMQPMNGSTFQASGVAQLAVYTADKSGNLTTKSTPENMPSVAVGGILDYWASPSGKLLAVAGQSGLQVFHFNGASPITKDTGLLVAQEVDQVFWDNSNHLYAIGSKAGKLWVFTVTANGVTQAPGSPHAITNPADMIVLPK